MGEEPDPDTDRAGLTEGANRLDTAEPGNSVPDRRQRPEGPSELRIEPIFYGSRLFPRLLRWTSCRLDASRYLGPLRLCH